MSMRIEVCAECGKETGPIIRRDVLQCEECGAPWKDKIITVYTDRELKQAQIEAYGDAIHIIISDSGWQNCVNALDRKVIALKQSMEANNADED